MNVWRTCDRSDSQYSGRLRSGAVCDQVDRLGGLPRSQCPYLDCRNDPLELIGFHSDYPIIGVMEIVDEPSPDVRSLRCFVPVCRSRSRFCTIGLRPGLCLRAHSRFCILVPTLRLHIPTAAPANPWCTWNRAEELHPGHRRLAFL